MSLTSNGAWSSSLEEPSPSISESELSPIPSRSISQYSLGFVGNISYNTVGESFQLVCLYPLKWNLYPLEFVLGYKNCPLKL